MNQPFFKKSTVFAIAIALLTSSCSLFLTKQDKADLKQARSSRNGSDSLQSNSETNSDSITAQIERMLKGFQLKEEPSDRKTYKQYNESATRLTDIIHTKLEVNFNFEKKQLNGKATIDAKPYYFSIDSTFLEAKSFDIKSIALLDKSGKEKPLQYVYRDNFIRIALDKKYTRNEQFRISIEYIAKPEEVTQKGSEAINSAKGLYFINPMGEEKNKPTQIWTQGETESSSCWFPTIDKPNEKMTHEIFITVPKKFKTLSNGLLITSKESKEGNRTDHWKMDLPHAPYLVMMAIGEYAVVKDKWRNVSVDYYVEPEFEKHAKKIFGNTPEMLEFFSKKLGVDYPWPKYSQVVVRDYVSGAMENTSASIFGEFIQQTPEKMLDQDFEDVIAHELFHHWFGDLVTCESWANLPLNESFATYSEYMWNEYKYGRDAADYHHQSDLSNYFQEAFTKKVDLVRYDYVNKEDMFDRHSYQKGGCVLLMLRKYLGDEAFYDGLKTYLNENKFQPAEIHHLRLAFEKVTGQDLNWFFNQWFLDRGHPNVEVRQDFDAQGQKVILTLVQKQDKKIAPVYKLPFDVDIYANGAVKRQRIIMESDSQVFEFIGYNKMPDLINVDGERQLLGVLNHEKSIEEYKFQFFNAPLYADRFEAIDKLGEKINEPGVEEVIKAGLMDKFHRIRQLSLEVLENNLSKDANFYRPKLSDLALKDKKSAVRALALDLLANKLSDASLENVFTKALSDSSVMVRGSALSGLMKVNPDKGKVMIANLEKEADGDLLATIIGIYASEKVQGKFKFMQNAYLRISDPQSKYSTIQSIGKYAISQTDGTREESIPYFTQLAKKETPWYVRLSAMQILAEMRNFFDEDAQDAYEKAYELKKAAGNQAQIIQWENKAAQSAQLSKTVLTSMEEVRDAETDSQLKKMYGVEE